MSVDHCATIKAHPVEDIGYEAAQAARTRQSRAAIVESSGEKTLIRRPGREGGVIELRCSHGRDDQDRADLLPWRCEEACRHAATVCGDDLLPYCIAHEPLPGA